MPNNNILSIHTADEMIDLNDLRVFAYVASFASFSLAADALKIHKSSVSRSIARLESMLETPLIQRTTRKVELTGRDLAPMSGRAASRRRPLFLIGRPPRSTADRRAMPAASCSARPDTSS